MNPWLLFLGPLNKSPRGRLGFDSHLQKLLLPCRRRSRDLEKATTPPRQQHPEHPRGTEEAMLLTAQ